MGDDPHHPRLQNLVRCPVVDRVIAFGETELVFCGVPLQVVRTPGHAPDHVCFITPDNVCFAGDVLMTEDVLAGAMVPFVFDMADDLKSKEIVAGLSCDAYIFCHKGIRYGSVAELAQMNIRHIQGQLAACGALVTEPMTYSQFYAAVVTAMDLPVGHPARGLHLERYIRPYLEYLVDRGDLALIEQNGAPAVAPKEARHGR